MRWETREGKKRKGEREELREKIEKGRKKLVQTSIDGGKKMIYKIFSRSSSSIFAHLLSLLSFSLIIFPTSMSTSLQSLHLMMLLTSLGERESTVKRENENGEKRKKREGIEKIAGEKEKWREERNEEKKEGAENGKKLVKKHLVWSSTFFVHFAPKKICSLSSLHHFLSFLLVSHFLSSLSIFFLLSPLSHFSGNLQSIVISFSSSSTPQHFDCQFSLSFFLFSSISFFLLLPPLFLFLSLFLSLFPPTK